MRAYPYRILVRGDLGRPARQAFEDFEIEFDGVHSSLIANVDQSALFSALNRVQSFGLELVEVARLRDDETDCQRPEWPGVADPAGRADDIRRVAGSEPA